MVYCGKPSKGCENCRSRRLKCDQKQPGCGQCRNTSRTCLGYRDPDALVFRDESARIKIKVQRIEARKACFTQPDSQSRERSLPSQYAAKHTPATLVERLELVNPIKHPIQDVAIRFLLGDYICGSHFDYLPSLYEADEKEALSPILQAVGLASLSLQTCRPELQYQARKLYVDAIARTNRALHSISTAKTNEVLASIMLLSLYETLSSCLLINMEAWNAHMQGALSLVTIRGSQQFETELGMALFKQIASSIRVFYVQHRVRIPQQLRDLTRMAKQYSYLNDVSFEHPFVVEAFTDLRADIAEGLLEKPQDIITRADEVLAITEDLQAKLPPNFHYDIVSVGKLCPAIHGCYYYRFADHHVAQMWNTTWMAILHLNTIIYEQVIRLSNKPSATQKCNVNLVERMTECQKGVIDAVGNICASVPQFFPPEDGQAPLRNTRKVVTGYFLIWPLFTAGSNQLISFPTRDYIIDRLKFIGNDLMLPQALKAARMLRQGDGTENWMHMYHVF